MKSNGRLIISLDFELFWGVRDKRTLDSYGDSIKKVHQIVPEMLLLFKEYNIHATFATVGFLFAENKDELIQYSPTSKPNYKEPRLSPYADNFGNVKQDSKDDPYHYAKNLIDLIRSYPGHEIASHTFSHYYCQEQGQTISDFEGDMEAAVAIAKKSDITIESLVFPRNQVTLDYLSVCKKNGINTYRGNEKVWFNKSESEESVSLLKRVFRTADCYVNISGHHTYSFDQIDKELPYNLPSSRFFRPYKKSALDILEKLKVQRILNSMTYAAKTNKIYHLWWHPHNFGKNTEKNFAALNKILEHYKKLNGKYGFESCSMKEAATILTGNNEKAEPHSLSKV